MSIESRVETVDPMRAQSWLESMVPNRPLGVRLVSFYADQMQRGQWQVNGESIKFDSTGRLIDGQHRLHAVIKAKTPIRAVVTRGLPDNSFETIDSGKRRGPSDVLGIAGEKNTAALASAARWCCYLDGSIGHNAQVSSRSILNAVAEHPELRVWCARMAGNQKIKSLMPAAALAVFVLGGKRYGDDVCLSFFNQIADGIGISKGDPAYELRERLIANKGSVAKLQTRTIVAFVVKAMNAYVKNKRIGILRWKEDEEFPELV